VFWGGPRRRSMLKPSNIVQSKILRRKLRKDMTNAERLLWASIRRKQIRGFQFRRQYSLENYIVDFYCPALRLVIEVDGPTHLSELAKSLDLIRQQEIESWGIKFLRFTNTDVYENIGGVIERIILFIEDNS